MPGVDPSNATQPPDNLAEILCPNCMSPNHANSHFCHKCNAPLTSHAATDPLGLVFATGHVIQKAASRPQSRIVLFGMWLIFGSLFLINLRALWYSFLALIYPVFHFAGTSVPNYNFISQLWVFLLVFGIEAVFIAILVKVTRNYRRGG